MTYSEKLKDPRWQRKRLEVLQRENFTCEKCLTTTETLHVHHGYYKYGRAPWEYDSDTLHCLCESCHEIIQDDMKELQLLIARLPAWMIEHFCWQADRMGQRYRGDFRKGVDDPCPEDAEENVLVQD